MANIIRFGGGAAAGEASTPIFGDGSDGDLVIAAGQTVSLEVETPYQSIVEKNYNSINIETGGILTTNANNNGLVIRCLGDCTINGTITQDAKSGKPDPFCEYEYPEDIVCGDGGRGGEYNGASVGTGEGVIYYGKGGAGMLAHKGGGGWSGGGGGGSSTQGSGDNASNRFYGGNGGSVDTITVNLDADIFVGGAGVWNGGSNVNRQNGNPGLYGGGGSGTNGRSNYNVGRGGTGAGGNGYDGIWSDTSAPGGGGAGNYGGGIIMLYVGGNMTNYGTISANGGKGGDAGYSMQYGGSRGYLKACGGGGGGGGAVYIVHAGGLVNHGSFTANGGAVGAASSKTTAIAGGLGSVIVKQYEKGMTK